MLEEINYVLQLKERIDYLQENYNNTGDEIVDDEEFDALVKLYEELTNKKYLVIGARSREDSIPLPCYAPSLDKIKDKKAERDLLNFLSRYESNLINMDKYDGISLILTYNNGSLICQKRGDGINGQDISFIKQYIDFPELQENLIIRGELILFEEDFEELKPYLIENGKKANNSRSVVNGATANLNADGLILSKCKFVPYSLYNLQSEIGLTQYEQLEYLKSFGFEVPSYVILSKEEVTIESLMEYLKIRRSEVKYRIDGTVLIFNIPVSVPEENKNPKHAIAIKQDTIVFTTVINCVWNLTSKDGYLTPVIEVDPIKIITNVTHITLSNGRMIYNHNIGPGAYIAITQGGDVIPKFLFTIRPAAITYSPNVEYIWNSNLVKIMVAHPENFPQIKCAKIKYFLDTLDIKQWGLLTIWKLYTVGINNIGKIIRVTKEQLIEADSVEERNADRLLKELHKGLKKATMPKIMAGSCIFGEGISEITMEKFIKEFPSWRNRSVSYDEIISKHSFGPTKSRIISEKLDEFKSWLNGLPELEGIEIAEVSQRSTALSGLVFYFTGSKDNILKQMIESFGGRVKENYVKEVNVVVKRDDSFTSNKVKDAENSNGKIRIMTKLELENLISNIRRNI